MDEPTLDSHFLHPVSPREPRQGFAAGSQRYYHRFAVRESPSHAVPRWRPLDHRGWTRAPRCFDPSSLPSVPPGSPH
jgi:hypothetical protein